MVLQGLILAPTRTDLGDDAGLDERGEGASSNEELHGVGGGKRGGGGGKGVLRLLKRGWGANEEARKSVS